MWYLEQEIRDTLKDAEKEGFSVDDDDRVLRIELFDNSIGISFFAEYDTESRTGTIRWNYTYWTNNSGHEELDAESWLLCVHNIANQIIEIIN